MPLHYPGYNYCGPGTKNFGRKPKNRIDRACRRHDKGYKNLEDYFKWNIHDYTFLQELKKYRHEDPVAADIMISIFEGKRMANKILNKGNDPSYVTHGNNKRKQHEEAQFRLPFKQKKIRRPNNPVDDQEDLTTNSRALNTSADGDRNGDQPMPRTTRYSKGRKRYRKNTRRYNIASKFKKRYRKSSSLSQRLARVLNPPITYESLQRCSAIALVSTTRNYSLVIDPSYYANANNADTYTGHGFFAGLTHKVTAIAAATGDTLAAADYGKQYWIMKPKMDVRLTNYTSGKLFFRVFILKCKRFTSDCTELLNDAAVEPFAPLYPNTDANLGGGAVTYGSTAGPLSSGERDSMFALNKMTSLRECKPFIRVWKIVRSYRFALDPNNNKTVTLRQKSQMFDSFSYYTNGELFQYKPGDMKMLIRIDSTITGTTDQALPTPSNVAYISYGPINVPYETYATGLIAKKTTNQMRRYQVAQFLNATGSTASLVTDNPGIIGMPVQTGGTDQNMTL